MTSNSVGENFLKVHGLVNSSSPGDVILKRAALVARTVRVEAGELAGCPAASSEALLATAEAAATLLAAAGQNWTAPGHHPANSSEPEPQAAVSPRHPSASRAAARDIRRS